MKSATLLALLPTALAASAGCKAPLSSSLVPGSSTHNLTIPSQSVIGKTTTREFILHLPANYSASNNVPAPLVFAFHGQSQHAWSMEQISELSNPDFNDNAVVVYPQGIPGAQAGVRIYCLHP